MPQPRFHFSLRSLASIVALGIVFCFAPPLTGYTETCQIKHEWKVGYWYWPGWARSDTGPVEKQNAPVDLLYVRVGEYSTRKIPGKQSKLDMSWPEYLPKADSYFAVIRYQGTVFADNSVIPALVGTYEALKRRIAQKGQRLVGLQVDYDSSTKDLARYGRFLSELRKTLPKEDLLSVTVLLGWFGTGTKIAEVIHSVDEFVPQFYDLHNRNLRSPEGGIAEPIDASKWAPIFNSYRKTYRIGIASFGRIVHVYKTQQTPSSSRSEGVAIGQQSPLEMTLRDRGTFVRHGTNAAGEVIAHYTDRGNGMTKMVIPTPQSVSTAYSAAKTMGGFCSGVIFFRHPVGNEALALSPSEIAGIISGKGLMQERTIVEFDDGFCVDVSCSDLFVRLKDRFPSKSILLAIRSSQDLEYFMADRLIQATLRTPRLIEVKVPAYAGVPRIRVGRAISRNPAQFEVEEKP
jgi:hypothetical protein